ncbi:hypothetical protein NQ317_014957 [Molorchus minor]|uniref:Uncharacterized protein n=1 Tax=Molorchus minor TaxID=1323400 RepID=A0ABQ9JHW8_9CUCU|nr:hypothetical protein NQ317_014957 [Molorchus minor]
MCSNVLERNINKIAALWIVFYAKEAFMAFFDLVLMAEPARNNLPKYFVFTIASQINDPDFVL